MGDLKTVVVVKEARRLGLSSDRGDYDSAIFMLELIFGSKCDLIILESAGDVEKRLANEHIDSLIFLSGGMTLKAREIKKHYPGLKVFVMTGLYDWQEPPETGVIVVDKVDLKDFEQMVLED